jgi:hypothetical protein
MRIAVVVAVVAAVRVDRVADQTPVAAKLQVRQLRLREPEVSLH